MPEQRHIGVYEDTKAEFDRIKPSGDTQDEFMSKLLEEWKRD